MDAAVERQARSAGRVVHNPEKSDRVVIHLPKALSRAVSSYQRRKMLPNRSEAIRQLLVLALETEKTARERPKE